LNIIALALEQFRSFQQREFRFAPEGALIIGPNGSGKTNILEAINYCAFGKSIRNAQDDELIGFSKAHFRIVGEFVRDANSATITAAYNKKKKVITYNSIMLDRISELYRYVRTVYFSPEDITIIGGAPGLRRSFLDQAISQYSFDYLQKIRHFYRLLKQRNALLKTDYRMQEKTAWDREYIESATSIVSARLEYLAVFAPLLKERYGVICGEVEDVALRYLHSFTCQDALDYRQQLAKQLNQLHEREKEQQRTLCGPHLDDIEFLLDGYSIRRFGSQGQKRSLAIAARLTQARLILQKNQDPPILMFDDVLADLDDTRSRNIIRMLAPDHQIFIASPHETVYQGYSLPRILLKEEPNETN
jgi:DNA replication and repair protein RecF